MTLLLASSQGFSLDKTRKMVFRKHYIILYYFIFWIWFGFICNTSTSTSTSYNYGRYRSPGNQETSKKGSRRNTMRNEASSKRNGDNGENNIEENDFWDALVSFSKKILGEDCTKQSTSFIIPTSILAATVHKLFVEDHLHIDINEFVSKQKKYVVILWDQLKMMVHESENSEKFEFLMGTMAGSFFLQKVLPNIQKVANVSVTSWLVATQLLPPILKTIRQQKNALEQVIPSQVTDYIVHGLTKVNDSIQIGFDWFHRSFLREDIENVIFSIKSLWEKEKPLWTGAAFGSIFSLAISFFSK